MLHLQNGCKLKIYEDFRLATSKLKRGINNKNMTMEAVRIDRPNFIDPTRIGRLSLEVPPVVRENDQDARVVSAKLLANGAFKRLPSSKNVYGLVMTQLFKGLKFGNERGLTGLVATTVPLNETGISVIENELQTVLEEGQLSFFGNVSLIGAIDVDEARFSYYQAEVLELE